MLEQFIVEIVVAAVMCVAGYFAKHYLNRKNTTAKEKFKRPVNETKKVTPKPQEANHSGVFIDLMWWLLEILNGDFIIIMLCIYVWGLPLQLLYLSLSGKTASELNMLENIIICVLFMLGTFFALYLFSSKLHDAVERHREERLKERQK